MVYSVEREIGGKTLRIESGKIGKQAGGSTVVSYGDTIVFCAAVKGDEKRDLGFFPLTVDYREKNYAAGKIPGGFFKREGRPTTKEILTMRMIDRPIRPLFPDNYFTEVAVSTLVVSADKENDPDILAMIAASASLSISEIPFMGPTGSVRIGLDADGGYIVNPLFAAFDNGPLDLIVSGTEDAITMIESGASEVSEEVMLGGLEKAHEVIKEVIAMIKELQEQCGKEKDPAPEAESTDDLAQAIRDRFGDALKNSVPGKDKMLRKKTQKAVVEEVLAHFCPEDLPEGETPEHEPDLVKSIAHDLLHDYERELILTGSRTDDRRFEEIRDITSEVGVLPRAHGSTLFTRGETQALVVCTLGTELDEQRIDGLQDERRERFILHYDFPAFSVGEAWPNRGPKRREIGHGNLARRALMPVLPFDDESFPYTLRVTSDIMESNGSSSMATVCGGSLALMDAGVPIKRAVAGIAMGMIKEGDQICILSDIQGSEDHNGDLDFKVAGTSEGITALQLDCKVKGIGYDTLERALNQAREGRMHILGKMGETLAEARDHQSPYAPRVERFKIDPEKIGLVIGPSGKTIRKIQEDTSCTIAVIDDGTVSVWSENQENAQRARAMIEALTEEAEIGKVYEGKVVSIKDFGCFVEILPGQEGLVHVSELSSDYVDHPSEVTAIGEILQVKCINVDDQGKVKLSVRALTEDGAEGEDGERPERPPRRPRSGGRDGRDRGGDRRRSGGGGSRPPRGRSRRPERDGGGRGGSRRGGPRDRDRDRGPRGGAPRGDSQRSRD